MPSGHDTRRPPRPWQSKKMVAGGAVVAAAWVGLAAGATVYSIADAGCVAGDTSTSTMQANTAAISSVLAGLAAGDTLYVPDGVWHLYGGIYVSNLAGITIDVDGTLSFATDRDNWPRADDGDLLHCFGFQNVQGLTITSSAGTGIFEGNGHAWWGIDNYLEYGEDRPVMLRMWHITDLLIERLLFKDPPLWVTDISDVDGAEIQDCKVLAKWDATATNHGGRELEAFNTDGFDLSGKNVHIHDVDIWTQDDCIAVKDLPNGGGIYARCSENWLVERVNCSGLGLTIGSIGATSQGTCVRNITFRDSTMVSTVKGVYIKSRPGDAGTTSVIENVVYQNITITSPESWPIWIGPAQQADTAGACALTWPDESGAVCPVSSECTMQNITLRDIEIINPSTSPGVILGNESNPIKSLVFDNVIVRNPALAPWGKSYYACYGVEGSTMGDTWPRPPCFDGGPQCLNATRYVANGNSHHNGCGDDDAAIEELTGGFLSGCSEALQHIGPDVCSDPSHVYYAFAQRYCKSTCGLCGRRRRAIDYACHEELSYICGADSVCSGELNAIKRSPATAYLGFLGGILAVIGVMYLVLTRWNRRQQNDTEDQQVMLPLTAEPGAN